MVGGAYFCLDVLAVALGKLVQHIQAEEGTAYPSAQALLGEGDLRTMGLEMAGRRRAS